MKKYDKIFEDYLCGEVSLENFLNLLPETTERMFENLIIKLIATDKELDKKATDLLNDSSVDENILFKTFYLLCSLHRRRKDISRYGAMFGMYGQRFEREKVYGYLKAMYLFQTGQDSDTRQAVELCSKSLIAIKDNIGIMHCYCEIVSEAFEDKVLDVNSENDLKKLNKANDVINDVIYNNEEDYAKFYCTYGRILALNGDYKRAKIEIKKAIDKEESCRDDYSLRIGEYTKHLMAISSVEQIKEIEVKFSECDNKIDEFNSKIGDTLSKNLEFLGFFAALVSFIIASVQMISQQDIESALKLIITLGGVQMLVIGSFSVVLNGKKGYKRSILVFCMGVITILFAMKLI